MFNILCLSVFALALSSASALVVPRTPPDPTSSNGSQTAGDTMAGACPTCKNNNDIDLSVDAFKKFAAEEQGAVPIKWKFG